MGNCKKVVYGLDMLKMLPKMETTIGYLVIQQSQGRNKGYLSCRRKASAEEIQAHENYINN